MLLAGTVAWTGVGAHAQQPESGGYCRTWSPAGQCANVRSDVR